GRDRRLGAGRRAVLAHRRALTHRDPRCGFARGLPPADRVLAGQNDPPRAARIPRGSGRLDGVWGVPPPLPAARLLAPLAPDPRRGAARALRRGRALVPLGELARLHAVARL